MAFDLNALIAEQPKIKGKKRFTFDFDGTTYTLPNEIDSIAVQAAADGFVVQALERLLGPDQWATLKKSPTVLRQEPIVRLLAAYYQHVGATTAGESEASSTSSTSTARPSKRTSNGSTRRGTSQTSARRS